MPSDQLVQERVPPSVCTVESISKLIYEFRPCRTMDPNTILTTELP